MKNIRILITVITLLITDQAIGQANSPGSEGEFQGFSAELFPAKRTKRGASLNLDDLVAFSKGSIKSFELQNQYKKVFLGSDFFDEAKKQKSCDSLKQSIGKDKLHFVPISDGKFFDQTHFTKIEELEGYYRFKNSKNLPGILPNVDVWIKMETYKHAKSTDKNCLVIKFLIPEDHNGTIQNNAYAMRNDGILVSIPVGTDPDFSLKLDFAKYCLFPLNDPQETTHLIGTDFTIMGSFAKQKQCDNINGLLFPISKKGNSNGCVFFRKMASETAPRF